MPTIEQRCGNCERPIVRQGLEWVHAPIEPEGYAFHYCTIKPNVPLSSNPHATPAAGPNTGHGHVRPRPDGARARCGGPAICSVCAKEAAQVAGRG